MAQAIVERHRKVIWAAGFIDGEGSIGIQRRSDGYFALRINVGQTNDIRPLLILQELFGGGVYRGKTTNQWQIEATKAQNALEELIPHLVVKREQAEVALDFQKNRRPHGKRCSVGDAPKYLERNLSFQERLSKLKKQKVMI